MSTLHIPSVWDNKPYKRISTMQTMPIRAVGKNSYTQIRDQILSEIPMLSSVWSAYMSTTTTIKIFSVMFDEFLPIELRRYIIGQAVKHFSKPKLTLVIDEEDGSSPNDMFNAAEVYLCSKFNPDSDRLSITKSVKNKNINIMFAECVEIEDSFEGISVTWKYTREPREDYELEKKNLQLIFDKRFKDIIISSYLPLIVEKTQELANKKKVVKIHNLRSGYSRDRMHLDHPSTFDTLAMDPKKKKDIKDDLDLFVKRKDFYKKVGKAWKRGREGIYCMGHLGRGNRVIEDIDCSAKVPNRKGTRSGDDPKFSLSGLLNFIDGLWSCCGDERIIIFTTNDIKGLDPALLRPGHMDMHIHMSYLTFNGFKTLVANYLNIHDHWRFNEIEELIKCKKVTPAEVAEELMKSDNAEVVLEGIVKFLKRSKDACRTNSRIDAKVHKQKIATPDFKEHEPRMVTPE
ncbi:P-loop containing nucleoside triphosphate hydrolases superfamily protein [Artemisia annua]|uniref:P-loop containing nucleoside triphosphate hydrolases superfamily protein n=1 Tax=Artemisia annua TaxID=35608 RepID=A0A2U1NAZ7_ARTAN|nr:P-loop containing nucleoside triphosphate hydrolases superfamily protein [Artemisia annua]